MRIFLAALVAALALTPSAMANIVEAAGSSAGGGYNFSWSASYDTDTNTLLFECDMTDLNTGAPIAPKASTVATVSVIQANGQVRSLDCLPIVNLGLQTYDHTNLKVDTVGRWSGFYIDTVFTP